MDNPKIIYLDVCVLCRPFDDQSYLRIRMETEAVNLILSNMKKGKYVLAVSKVHLTEIDSISNIYERVQLKTILDEFGLPISVNILEARERAEVLVRKGFGIADAAHIAFAEKGTASFFITCDDRLLKKCLNNKIKVQCTNPVIFCEMEKLK